MEYRNRGRSRVAAGRAAYRELTEISQIADPPAAATRRRSYSPIGGIIALGILVQTQMARALAATDPDRLDPVLERVEHAAGEALDAMRRTVGILRTSEAGHPAGRRLVVATGVARRVGG